VLRLNGIKSLTVEARSNVLQAAGYTTRRYVKLLRRSVEAPFPVSPARSSRRQEGVLLQGHPRPWPVAKPRTLWVPAHKVQFRIGARWGGRCCASILPPPRTPALDKEAPAGPCPHCRRSRAGSFRRQRPGSRQSRQPRLRRLHSAVSRIRRLDLMSGPRPQRPRAGPSAAGVLPSIQRCHGPGGPGPRRPSVPTYCRSLPADGSLGSPVRCTVKARHSSRADATDRLRGHAPLASLVPRHWWFVDSGPGARGQVLHYLPTPWRRCG